MADECQETLHEHSRQALDRSISSSETACPGPVYFSEKRVLAVLLDLRLDIANTCLDLAGVLLELSFCFQIVIAGDMADDFFHFAFGFFVAAFDLLFVHVSVLSMNGVITPARNVISQRLRGNICARWITVSSVTHIGDAFSFCALPNRRPRPLRSSSRWSEIQRRSLGG
ncbi:conserved hypothetical protein [Candidatus Contendobacter odensis Run_B_J11]|uniref:Uncharacterized protein n=1 Tax=Candidatus Contendobacter odensis Run_B_J11 TaxID=1400861 RepID=A0A7U7GBS9_9GAMM|nr:conserved hypothetical protein [Candidatus Contendobacter odensis Run_B_J11]